MLNNLGIHTPGWPEGEDAPMFWPYLSSAWPAHVLPTGEEHLGRFLTISEGNQLYIERLTYLAWLWANGYVYDTPEHPYHVVDRRYIVDPTWFGGATVGEVYSRFELAKLGSPLLEVPWIAS
jgi:hypothetical protein